MNLEDFKFGRTKITSLSIVDDSSPELINIMQNWTELTKNMHMHNMDKPNSILVCVLN